MKKVLNRNSGITLIALVITIVVLIILVTVALRLTLGDDGIIGSAKKSSEMYTNAQNDENYQANAITDNMEELITRYS